MTTDLYSFNNPIYLDKDASQIEVALDDLGVVVVDRNSGPIWDELQDKIAKGIVVVGDYVPIPISPTDVNLERDLRINGIMTFEGHKIEVDADSKARINGAVTLATVALSQGIAPDTTQWLGNGQEFNWITADNQIVPMDISTVIRMGQKAGTWETSHVFAARALKLQNPIPEDYKDDKYWPSQ